MSQNMAHQILTVCASDSSDEFINSLKVISRLMFQSCDKISDEAVDTYSIWSRRPELLEVTEGVK